MLFNLNLCLILQLNNQLDSWFKIMYIEFEFKLLLQVIIAERSTPHFPCEAKVHSHRVGSQTREHSQILKR